MRIVSVTRADARSKPRPFLLVQWLDGQVIAQWPAEYSHHPIDAQILKALLGTAVRQAAL